MRHPKCDFLLTFDNSLPRWPASVPTPMVDEFDNPILDENGQQLIISVGGNVLIWASRLTTAPAFDELGEQLGTDIVRVCAPAEVIQVMKASGQYPYFWDVEEDAGDAEAE